MRAATLALPVLLVTQPGLAQQPDGGQRAAEDRLDLLIVDQDWGTKVPDPGNANRFDLRGHRTSYYLGAVRLLNLDDVAKQLADRPNNVALVVKSGPGVTLGDVVAVMDAARQLGFTHLRLGAMEGRRVLPRVAGSAIAGPHEKPSREPFPARVDLAHVEPLDNAGILPPRARSGSKPVKPPAEAAKGRPDADGRLASMLDIGQEGHLTRDGNRIFDPELESVDRLDACIEALVAPHTGPKPIDVALVIRADIWTEMHHVTRVLEACGRTSVPIARVLLGVRPAAGARGAREPEPVKR
jgi:hypothetical protein